MFESKEVLLVKISKGLLMGLSQFLATESPLTLSAPIPQNGQTHSKTICRQIADELLEYV